MFPASFISSWRAQALYGAFSCISLALAYVADKLQPRHRAPAFGYVMASLCVGVLIGPLLGGALQPARPLSRSAHGPGQLASLPTPACSRQSVALDARTKRPHLLRCPYRRRRAHAEHLWDVATGGGGVGGVRRGRVLPGVHAGAGPRVAQPPSATPGERNAFALVPCALLFW